MRLMSLIRIPHTLCLMLLCLSINSIAQVSMSTYSAIPPTMDGVRKPLVMLVMSRDNQLWHKAYNDYSDLDGDGRLDTTYNDKFTYFGYFNSSYCYNYSGTTDLFSPVGLVDDLAKKNHLCTTTGGGEWSGNFLNWLTTTRIDVVRKVLYGGYRSTDDTDKTILQRAMVPTDNHAFVKIVSNAAINDGDDLNGVESIANLTSITHIDSNDQVISFCNVTDGNSSGANRYSKTLDTVAYPPKLKVAAGAQQTWAGSERKQCLYQDEGGDAAYSPTRPASVGGTQVPMSGSDDAEMVVRVEVCKEDVDAVDPSACREYVGTTDSSYKPFGLLQTYGESGQYRFGLLTGSYLNNHNGGVLRKNISYFGGSDASDSEREINSNTGQFEINTVDDSGNPLGPDNGIIKTLNTFRIQGWDFNKGRYSDCNYPGASVDLFISDANKSGSFDDNGVATAFVDDCRDWGNPLSEIYLEALRYFTGPVNSSSSSSGGATFAGTASYAGDDSSVLPGLSVANWQSPFTASDICSQCSVIVLSTGLNNFDDDVSPASSLPGITGSNSIEAYTDSVGMFDNIAGENFIVANAVGATGTLPTPGTPNECDTKTIGDLSGVKGICPEVPSLQGTYNLAGAAYYAHQTDINENLDKDQKVKTYTVSLAESLPSFEIKTKTADKSVTIVPTCRANSTGAAHPTEAGDDSDETPWRECSLVDLTVLEQTDDYGRLLISWEDSTWGNDYDMDAYTILEYCTASSADQNTVRTACDLSQYPRQVDADFNDHKPDAATYDYSPHQHIPQWSSAGADQIQIRLSLVAASAGHAMKFGYTVNGAAFNADGAYVNEIVRYGGHNGRADILGGSDDIVIWNATSGPDYYTKKFTASGVPPQRLENPLWYAAKYGNFTDANDNEWPDDPSEFDNYDTNGEAIQDGIPDAYFPVSNPANLPRAMASIFERIGRRISSGSATALTTLSGGGDGLIYQGIYTPFLEKSKTNEFVSWFGTIHAMFVDKYGRLRADSNGDQILTTGEATATDNDQVMEFEYNEATGETDVSGYYVDQNDDIVSDTPSGKYQLSSLSFKPVWSAADELAELALASEVDPSDDSLITENRTYAQSTSQGRYIFTAFDSDGVGNPGSNIVNSSDADTRFEFEVDSFISGGGGGSASPIDDYYRYLSVGGPGGSFDDEKVSNLINYVRGKDVASYRSRRLDYNDDNSITKNEVHILGDIVHSSAVEVGAPHERFDLYYGDPTYADYYARNKSRRKVIYVGANDGMLHAFNAGKFDFSTGQFDLTDRHPLGSELWAYIPYNALPHLKWLTAPDYSHVYYVDGPVQKFDVNIFQNKVDGLSAEAQENSPYQNGWGTIIVAGMRFGGGEYTYGNGRKTGSAYIVMDVTDPESAPELIAEITHPDLGFTTSLPKIVKARKASVDGDGNLDYTNNPEMNNWYLVFGSGPGKNSGSDIRNAIDNATSNQDASVFLYDLKNQTLQKYVLYDTDAATPTTEVNSFMGDFAVVDWDLDYIDDAVYVGVVNGTPEIPGGKLKRGKVTAAASSVSLNFTHDLYKEKNVPFVSEPLTYRTSDNEWWVFAGSGRFFAVDDNLSDSQQYFFGIKEPINTATHQRDLDETVTNAGLYDTSNVNVLSNGFLSTTLDVDGIVPPKTDDGFNEDLLTHGDLEKYIEDEKDGWMFAFRDPDDPLNSEPNTNHPQRMRNIAPAIDVGKLLAVTAYKGTGEVCTAEGNSYLFVPSLKTGVPDPNTIIGDADNNTDETTVVNRGIEVGPGLISGWNSVGPHFGGNSSGGSSGSSSGASSSSGSSSSSSSGGGCNPSTDLTGGSTTGDLTDVTITTGCIKTGRSGWREIPVTW